MTIRVEPKKKIDPEDDLDPGLMDRLLQDEEYLRQLYVKASAAFWENRDPEVDDYELLMPEDDDL
jgi:hypothetical protein